MGMLEDTKSVLEKRLKEIPECPDSMRIMREYFEDGCLCVQHGDIHVPKEEPDSVACVFYMMWCGCNRHPDYHSEDQ